MGKQNKLYDKQLAVTKQRLCEVETSISVK